MASTISRISFWALPLLLVLESFGPFLNPIHAISINSSSIKLESGRRFWISNDTFWKDGNPFQIVGGDLHYFRVLPQYWEDRLLRAKSLGLNVIQTYVPWNLHEPQSGEWSFDGIADLESFLKLAHKLGFLIMLRAGPYVCAEWDLGGFPAWLLAQQPTLTLRSSDAAFLYLVKRWWDILFPKIVSLLYNNGGPVIMVQVENEYGSYGDDKAYLQYLVSLARGHFKDDVILYTTDGGAPENLNKGTIPGSDVYSAVDFSTGEDPWPIFSLQKKYNTPGKSPALCTEFYTGWLTHWGEELAQTNGHQVASELDKILSKNGSAVLYMAHGGTNFGFFSGANTGQSDSDYRPDITSYDYDAPIGEAGDVDNVKFKALRDVIGRYNPNPLPAVPTLIERRAYGKVRLQKIASLFEALELLSEPPEGIMSFNPVPMESLQQMFGFILYQSTLPPHTTFGSTLSIPLVHDRAQIFVAHKSDKQQETPIYVGTIQRWSNSSVILPDIVSVPGFKLLILVFGRGGEEMDFLQQQGIQVKVIPGITAASGIAASLGIPLTHRGVANNVRFLTGHSRKGGTNPLFVTKHAADPDSTLVIYMGLATISTIAHKLISEGLSPIIPAAAIERGTTPQQRVVFAELQNLADDVINAQLVSPTLIIIGNVVALSPYWPANSSTGQTEKNKSKANFSEAV